MRKRFLVLASVATMALAGTAMPAFADSGTAATTTTATPVSITCNVTTKTSTGASTTSSYTLNVSQQAATYLTANTPRTVTYSFTPPGGSVSAGLGMIDTMRFLRCDVATTCIGMAASMGACLLAAGSKGKRAVLQNSQVMLHQPLIGGVLQGPATDLGIEAAHMLRLRDRLYKLMSEFTGKPADTIHRDFDRNKWLFAEEAVEYGCCDRVLDRAPETALRRVEDNGGDEKD